MRILIIEDEPPAAQRLSRLIQEYSKDIVIHDVIDSVDTAIRYLNLDHQFDLIFMDIQLSDGLSFEIFDHCQITTPIIFTTAFDQYTLKAFKLNSVDYLLKPVEPNELSQAINKFKNIHLEKKQLDIDALKNSIHQVLKKNYKERFLTKSGKEIKSIPVSEVAYFYSEQNYTHLRTNQKHTYIVDYKLDELVQLLDPSTFFRVNRQMICRMESIRKIEPYFNGRLFIELEPAFNKQILVSRERAISFKSWLDQ